MDFLNALKQIVFHLGYAGVFAATALEYGCFPVSSEILLPFIGYMTSYHQRSLFFTILCATAGGLVGSLFCYTIGRLGGRGLERLADRFRSIRIGIQKAQSVFRKYGNFSVFLARIFPLARTYISFPAGMAKMPLLSFCLFTCLGALLWNTMLISCGYFLGNHWEACKAILKENQWVLFALPLILLIWYIHKKRKK